MEHKMRLFLKTGNANFFRWTSKRFCRLILAKGEKSFSPERCWIGKNMGKTLALFFFFFWIPAAMGDLSLLLVNGIGQKEYRIDPQVSRMLHERLQEKIWTSHAVTGMLNQKMLNQFQVVLFTYPPWEGDQRNIRPFEEKIPLLLEYVAGGGGLLIFADEMYRSYENLNKLTSRIGVTVLPEGITDPKALFRQSSYFRYYASHTDNLNFSHPIVQNVKRLFYPIGNTPDNRELHHHATLALRTSPEWETVVRGNLTAFSSSFLHRTRKTAGTYQSEPPFLVTRSYGKGRIVVFSTRSRDYVHEAYHPVFEQMCLKNGDGEQLIANLLSYLSEPARKNGFPGGFSSPEPSRKHSVLPPELLNRLDPYEQLSRLMKRTPAQFEEDLRKEIPLPKRKTFRGILGACIGLSDSMPEGEIRQKLDAFRNSARTAEIDFLVFTEDFLRFGSSAYQRFERCCRELSSQKVLLIPGLLVTDLHGDQRIAVAPPEWPRDNWLVKGTKFISPNHSYAYFGWNWTPYFLIHLNQAKFRPQDARFYTGIAIEESAGNGRTLDFFAEYLNVQSRDYNLIPVQYSSIRNPAELKQLKTFTYVQAETQKQIVSSMKYHFYAERPVYVSSGPELAVWTIRNGRGGLRDERWNLQLAIRSRIPLESVTVYDQDRIWRRFFPDGRDFQVRLSGYHDRQRAFTLVARDRNGGILRTSSLYTNDFRHQLTQCTDLQNTISTVHGISRSGTLCSYGGLGDTDSCWDQYTIRNTYPDQEMRPRTGIELGYKGWKLSASPKWNNQLLVGSPEFTFNSGDLQVAVTPHDRRLQSVPGSYEPVRSKEFSAEVEHRNWTSHIYGINIHGIRQKIAIARSGVLEQEQGTRFLHCFAVDFPRDAFDRITILREDGSRMEKKRNPKKAQVFTVVRNGAFILTPDVWGGCAFIPLDGDYQVKVTPGRAVFRKIFPDRKTLNAGDRILTDVLFACGKFNEAGTEAFETFRRSAGIGSETAWRMEVIHGQLKNRQYELKIKAEDSFAEFRIRTEGLAFDLPVLVQNLNANWDAGVYDHERKTLNRIGIWNEQGCFQIFRQKADAHLTAGSLFTCSDPEIRLGVVRQGRSILLEVHNPGSEVRSVTVFPGIVRCLFEWKPMDLKISPGSSQIIQIEKELK